MQHTQPRLPVELIDHTVDFLHDDIETLWSCTSISRTFLRSARYHLFHTLTIADELQQDGTRGYATFLRFLVHAPEVCAYIHSVKFVRYHPFSDEVHLPFPEISSHALGEMLSYLPRLHTVALGKGIHIVASSSQTTPALADRSNHPRPRTHHHPVNQKRFRLSSLSLDAVRFATRKDLSDLLRLFSEIGRLALSDLCILQHTGGRKNRNGENLSRDRLGAPSEENFLISAHSSSSQRKDGLGLDVEELLLGTAHSHESSTIEVLSIALGQQLNFRSLRTVTLEFDNHRHLETFGALLSRSADWLESLTLRLPAHPYAQVPCEYWSICYRFSNLTRHIPSAQEWRRLHLQSLKQLKTLTFIEEHHPNCDKNVQDIFSGEANRAVCASIKNMLPQMPTGIEELRFQFRLRAFGTGSAGQLMDNFGWSEVEEVTGGLEYLKKVVFAFQGRPEGDRHLKAAIENHIPVLQARGLLEMVFEA